MLMRSIDQTNELSKEQ